MGSYIEVPAAHGKAKLIETLYSGQILPWLPRWEDIPDGKALIVVVDNGAFEAAGYAYCENEYRAFTDRSDYRPREYVLMDKTLADALTGRAAG
jgi:hypothetical protein